MGLLTNKEIAESKLLHTLLMCFISCAKCVRSTKCRNRSTVNINGGIATYTLFLMPYGKCKDRDDRTECRWLRNKQHTVTNVSKVQDAGQCSILHMLLL